MNCSIKLDSQKEVRIDVDGERPSPSQEKAMKIKTSFKKCKSFPANSSFRSGSSRSKKWTKDMYSDILKIDENPLPKLVEEEAVGVITMEDVIEELLQVVSVHAAHDIIIRLFST